MNPTAGKHPEQEQLAAFGLGQLSGEESVWIEKHLDECDECNQTLVNLSDDTFAGVVRSLADSPAARLDFAPSVINESTGRPSLSNEQTDGAVADVESKTAPTMLLPGGESVEPAEIPVELREHPRYRIVELIGRGGMGDVYRAEHKLMSRPVALKLINSQLIRHPQAVERFRREVQAAAQLHHPNIVTAHDAEQAGNLHFLAMEFVDGTDLAKIVKDNGPLPVETACDYICQAAAGLQHAHEKGMVHRDIKPHNLMFTETGGVKILDFGLASFATETVIAGEEVSDRNADGASTGEVCERSESERTSESRLQEVAAHLTSAGSVMGTPDYIAPEQARDAHSADIRADIYSLGCTLYFLLTGQPPFVAGNVVEKLKSHAEQSPKPLSELRHDVPRELSDVVLRMLAKDPAERFVEPRDVAAALVPFVAARATTAAGSRQPLSARKPAAPLSPTARLIRTLAAMAGILLLGAVIVIATDRGRVEIQTEVGDVKVLVKQGGETITVDLKTGSKITWVPTGDVEFELVGSDNSVKLDKNSFHMTRLGKVIVTVRWNDEGSGVIRSFTTDDPTILQDNIEVADDGWKITANDAQTVRLFEVPMPPMNPGPFFYRAKLKTENVKGRAYLEMCVRFPGQGEFFSKGFHNALSGTNGWAEYEIPFLLEKGQQPDQVKLNLTIEGSGTVWIKDVEVRGRAMEAVNGDATVSDEKRLQGKWSAVSGHSRKKPLTAAELAQLSITFDGERVEFVQPSGPPTPIAVTFTIHPNRDPRQIDFVAPGKQQSMTGIYELDGEWLKLALIDQDYSRPTNFEPDHRPDHLTAVFEQVPVAATLGDEERKVLKAAEAFLIVADLDKFDQLRDVSSTLAKSAATKEQVSRQYQLLRDTVGKATQRTLQRLWLIDEFPGLPAGRYACVEYRTHFASREGPLFESAVLNFDADGQWRVNTYAATLEPLPIPGPQKAPAADQKPSDDQEKKAATAVAREWLKLVDAGKFAECWEGCAAFAKSQITQEQVAESYDGIRKPLGNFEDRTLLSANSFPQLPGTPPGESIVVQFAATFSIGGKQLEQVTLFWDQDNRWRVAGYHVTAAPSRPKKDQDDPATEQKKQAALNGAEQWLKLIDAGKYGEAWDTSAKANKDGIKRDGMDLAYQGLFQPLGPIKSRELKTNEYKTQLPRAPVGEYAVMQFSTQFNNGRVTETVVLTREADSHWRVSGYFHAKDESAPTPPAAAPASKNFITDPSFEATAPTLLPSSWSSWLTDGQDFRCEVVNGGRTGQRSLHITGKGTRGVVFANSVPVDRSKRFALKGWAKFEGNKDARAIIKFNYFHGGKWLGANDLIGVKADQPGWQLLEKTDALDAHPEASTLVATCHVEGNGSAWFDDLELIAFDRDKLPIDFESRHGRHNRLTGPLSLERWVGAWETHYVFRESDNSPNETKLTMNTAAERTLGDFFLMSHAKADVGEEERLLFLTFDQNLGAFRQWFFSSNGKVFESRGQWNEAANSLELRMLPDATRMTSTERFVDADHIEATMRQPFLMSTKEAGGWMAARKAAKAKVEISAVAAPVAEPAELSLLNRFTGEWTIRETAKPSAWLPDGQTKTSTERVAWILGGKFLMAHRFDEQDQLMTIWLATYEPSEKSYHFWFFMSDGVNGQWRVTWDAAARGFHWRSTDMPAGWIGTGFNRWVDDDTFDNQALIKDGTGRVLLDSRHLTRRKK